MQLRISVLKTDSIIGELVTNSTQDFSIIYYASRAPENESARDGETTAAMRARQSDGPVSDIRCHRTCGADHIKAGTDHPCDMGGYPLEPIGSVSGLKQELIDSTSGGYTARLLGLDS